MMFIEVYLFYVLWDMMSNGVIATSAPFTSRRCYPYYDIPEFIHPENWPANNQYLNSVDFSACGDLPQKLFH